MHRKNGIKVLHSLWTEAAEIFYK